MERAGYWSRDISVPAPPAPDRRPAEPDPFSQLSEADRYAVMYPDRATRIRAAGGLPGRPGDWRAGARVGPRHRPRL